MTHAPTSLRPWLATMLLSLAVLALPAQAAEIELVIEADTPGATIHKNVYGQFVEHLGRGIYEGIWVGEGSDIPNTHGYRNDVLAALKELQVPLLRWPGGCFADQYHWRDGIGPRAERPRRVNTNWGGVIEDNAFGTHEFLNLAELLGADAYVNGNLGTGSPREMAEWVEYITADGGSTLAELRRRNGRAEPWRLHYFAIGNEAWGCGGNMRPAYYVDLYNRYASFVKAPEDNQPRMIASGGHGEMTEWTEAITSGVKPNWSLRLDGISHHYYTRPTGEWETKGPALGFDEAAWFATLRQTLQIEDYIAANKAVLARNDPDGKYGFYLDEWGTWYDPEEGENPGFLFQQNSLRDAIVAALNFNIFHEHADRVHMAVIAQMVNVLQAMILTDKEKMLLTPTYHAFHLYRPFQGATALPVRLSNAPDYRHGGDAIPGLSASAARDTSGNLQLALVNPDPNTARQVRVSVQGGEATRARGRVLTARAMDAHNTFGQPEAVRPGDYAVDAQDGEMKLELPPKSVMVVMME
ncbi:alpha-L-arabinofuranosidase C-terminal domain-containing protein [Luteimonas sp. RD2P54]|uniref:non-reducing end alpha-L-arabinofuranosidase n=1 Tax=Luteimonas endophytica TaxID=3042023 RepID=A0ABT6J6R6_9GAMM|nr:alpha-L-arabinofuranosidase C-terminal domain-containing protein [Luteimonas endophytica]MDH5822524.1 alpha-L-arabinofuranosidase C-terminal domain-containing protein [Luteimonas endophytica]